MAHSLPDPRLEVNAAFPAKLYDLVENGGDAVGWLPMGDAFIIRDNKKFEDLLPIYFKHRKLSSFQRQLNLYGFRREKELGSYQHPCFLRNRKDLVPEIRRVNKPAVGAAPIGAASGAVAGAGFSGKASHGGHLFGASSSGNGGASMAGRVPHKSSVVSGGLGPHLHHLAHIYGDPYPSSSSSSAATFKFGIGVPSGAGGAGAGSKRQRQSDDPHGNLSGQSANNDQMLFRRAMSESEFYSDGSGDYQQLLDLRQLPTHSGQLAGPGPPGGNDAASDGDSSFDFSRAGSGGSGGASSDDGAAADGSEGGRAKGKGRAKGSSRDAAFDFDEFLRSERQSETQVNALAGQAGAAGSGPGAVAGAGAGGYEPSAASDGHKSGGVPAYVTSESNTSGGSANGSSRSSSSSSSSGGSGSGSGDGGSSGEVSAAQGGNWSLYAQPGRAADTPGAVRSELLELSQRHVEQQQQLHQQQHPQHQHQHQHQQQQATFTAQFQLRQQSGAYNQHQAHTMQPVWLLPPPVDPKKSDWVTASAHGPSLVPIPAVPAPSELQQKKDKRKREQEQSASEQQHQHQIQTGPHAEQLPRGAPQLYPSHHSQQQSMSSDDLELLMLLGSSKPEEDAAAVIVDAVYSAAYASVSGDGVFGYSVDGPDGQGSGAGSGGSSSLMDR